MTTGQARRLPEVTLVTAYTECGPGGECVARALPLESVDMRADGDVVEIAVSAQLPVGNPILEHPTFRASRALTLTCALPTPQSPMLCLYQHKEWWMRPTWVNDCADVPPRTQMLLWRSANQADRQWHLLFAVSNRACRADIRGIEGCADGVVIDVSTNQVGRTTVEGLALLYAYGDDPYALVEQCVRHAAQVNGIAAHRDMLRKPRLPEQFRGLGWCTWDSLGQQVSESAIIEKMREFQAKRVPVSWVLIDDGWSQTEANKLTGFTADSERFPHGLAHTVELLKHDFHVQYVGVWQAFQGYWEGVDSNSAIARDFAETLERLPNGMLIPHPDRGVAFWRAWDTELHNAGVDFVKVDSQSTMTPLTRGVESFDRLGARYEALEIAVSESFADNVPLINCMGMAPENIWNRPRSVLTRTSDDFFPRTPESLAEHVIENAYCSLMVGALYRCDWDMFWTRHPHARTHALLRWISGGPIYCSDALDETDFEVLRPFFDERGELTHPDGVGVPELESLLCDPVHGNVPLGIRNTFRGQYVVLYIGLNEDRPQTVHIRASGCPIGLFDSRTGDCKRLESGEERTIALDYGDCVLVAYCCSELSDSFCL